MTTDKGAVGSGPIGNHYDKYAAAHPIERRMMRGFFASLDELVATIRPRSILEVGVGEGEVLERMAQRFPEAVLKGIDLPDDALAAEWQRRSLDCEFGDATALRFEDRSFDLVLGIEVLEHVPDPDRALREIARVAAQHVVLSVPREPIWRLGNMARGRYLAQLGNTPGHVNHWSARGFATFVGTRFDVERVLTPLPWTMVRASRRPTG